MVIGKGQLHGRALPSPVAARGWRPHGRLHGAGWGGAVALAEGPKFGVGAPKKIFEIRPDLGR